MDKFIQGVVDNFIIFLFFDGLILFSLIRAGKKGRRKMWAVLIITIASAVIWAVYYRISIKRLPVDMAYIVPAVLLALGIIFRRVVFPFKGRCSNCGKKLSITEFLFVDDYCHACYEKLHPETVKIPLEEQIRRENEEKKKGWIGWTPEREFVIVFAFDREEQENVLLMDDLRIQKAPGKYSGCIGEVKDPSRMSQVASKTLEAETGLICEAPDYMGRLNFDMPTMDIRFHIFIAREFSGTVKPGTVKNPVWMPLKKLKYEQMSMDYPLWLPRTLRGQQLEYYAKCNTEGKIYEDILDLDVRMSPEEEPGEAEA